MRTPGRVDIAGAVILAAGLSAVLIAVSRGQRLGLELGQDARPRRASACVILAAFVVFERRHTAPLINMRTLSRPPVLITDFATLLVGFGLFGTFVLIPQLAELPTGGDVGLGLNATEAGLLMAPGGLVMLLVAPIVGRVSERIGSKLPLARRRLLAAGGLARHGARARLGAADHALGPAAQRRRRLRVRGAAEPRDRAVDPHETGEATGVNTIARNVGASLGGQVAASIVAEPCRSPAAARQPRLRARVPDERRRRAARRRSAALLIPTGRGGRTYALRPAAERT